MFRGGQEDRVPPAEDVTGLCQLWLMHPVRKKEGKKLLYAKWFYIMQKPGWPTLSWYNRMTPDSD